LAAKKKTIPKRKSVAKKSTAKPWIRNQKRKSITEEIDPKGPHINITSLGEAKELEFDYLL